MRDLIITFLLFLSLQIYSQEKLFFASIPSKYEDAKTFVLLDSQKDTIISFNRNGRINHIQTAQTEYILKNRKILFDNKADTIAFFKRKKIVFPSQRIVVYEKKNKSGWSYFLGDNKILEISYIFKEEDKNYQITVVSKKNDRVTQNLIQFCLGKFDKRVVMDYGDDKYDFSTALIIAILVAIS